MRSCPSRCFFSRVLSSFSVLGSVSAAFKAPVRSFHATQKEVGFDRNPSSVTEGECNRVRYLKDFCALIRNLSNNSRDYVSLKALDSMLTKTHCLDSATSVLVIDGLCRLGKLVRAKTVLSNLKKSGNVSDYFLYSLVISCLVKDGRIGDADSFWNEVCGLESLSNPRIDASEFFIYLSKFGKVLEIENICKRVLVGGGVLREQSYIALIGALCKENKGLLAKKILQEMKNKGLKPDSLTYLTMFQCFCRNGDSAEADSILRKLARRKYRMDICIYGSFIEGLCKSGKFREAKKLVRKLVKREYYGHPGVGPLKEGRRAIFQLDCRCAVPEIMAYESFCRSLCAVGRLDEAETLLKEMMRKKTVPEVCVHKSFIKALFRAGRAEDAIRFFNVEKKKGFVSVEEIGGSIVRGLCEMGRVDDAWRIFDEIITNGRVVLETTIFNCLLGSYWKVERVAEAENLFERMREGSFRRPDVLTYTIMVNGFCEQGNIRKALCIFEEMLKNNVPVNGTLYEVIIRGLCMCGRLEEAHKYLNEMIQSGHLVSYIGWKSLFDSTFVGK